VPAGHRWVSESEALPLNETVWKTGIGDWMRKGDTADIRETAEGVRNISGEVHFGFTTQPPPSAIRLSPTGFFSGWVPLWPNLPVCQRYQARHNGVTGEIGLAVPVELLADSAFVRVHRPGRKSHLCGDLGS
jgi:hypothetical protein